MGHKCLDDKYYCFGLLLSSAKMLARLSWLMTDDSTENVQGLTLKSSTWLVSDEDNILDQINSKQVSLIFLMKIFNFKK